MADVAAYISYLEVAVTCCGEVSGEHAGRKEGEEREERRDG